VPEISALLWHDDARGLTIASTHAPRRKLMLVPAR
jgi:hypothetical protein